MSSLAELHSDYHVHSTFSDDAVSTIAENIAAAAAAGLTTIRLIDHVRSSTTWVPEFLAAVAAEPVPVGLVVLTGVETKIMDAAGTLDLPPGLSVGNGGLDAIVIADHQFPGSDGPWSPESTIQRLADGLSVGDALDLLVDGYVAAMRATTSAQLAHPFSILPKVGLSEDDLSDEQLARWASAAAETATLVEVNEKWGCPGVRVIRAARAAGAPIVAATDSHAATEVGRYDAVAALLLEEVAGR
jgi:putative hydrolase